jgi:hypothetical protein
MSILHDPTEVVRSLGLTRAWMTQLMYLTLLAPDIQEQILFAESVERVESKSEREPRSVAHVDGLATQCTRMPLD